MSSELNSVNLILVNSDDHEIGTMEKLEAHQKGLLHRAFSVMIYDQAGRLLIQKRAAHKYHSANLWANSCCGHPYPNENSKVAAERRLNEELGFTVPVAPRTKIKYALTLKDGLYEREFVHVFEGIFEESIHLAPNPEEVSEIAWVDPKEILIDALQNPEFYARWFKLYLFKYFNSVFLESPILMKSHE